MREGSRAPWRRAGRAALVALLPTAALAMASPASALAAPGSLAPTAASTLDNTPTFAWARVTGAARYEVQVDDDPGFGSPALAVSTTNSRLASTTVLPSGDLAWRVRAVTAAGSASAWATAAIHIGAVGVPVPQSPAPDAVLDPPQDVPLLSWSSVAGAASYTVQVDETDDFISPVVTATTKTTSYVAGPLPKGGYFWRVRATRATGVESAFSGVSGFSVGELPAVTGTSPADDPNAEVEDVVLTWDPVAGSAYYELQVSSDQDFNTLVDPHTTNVSATTRVYGTHYSPPVTYDNNQYYWRVRAVDTNGQQAPWSDVQAQFKRVWKDRATPVHPLGDVAGSPTHIDGDPYFQWTPVQHATEYELQLGTDPDFSPNTYAACRVAGTTYTPNQFQINHDTAGATLQDGDDCLVGPGTVYYWRVRPLDRPFPAPGIEGVYSQTQAFVWDDQVIPDSTHLTPAEGETVAVPTLTWTPQRDAVSYKVTLKNRVGSTLKSVTTYATSYTPASLTTALKATDGPFTWSVQAVPAGSAPSVLVHTGSFTVSSTLPTTGAAPLTALAGADPSLPTNRAPALRWEPSPAAATYEVQVGSHDANVDPSQHVWFAATSGSLFGTRSVYPALTDTGTRLLSPGSYDWRVRAYDASGNLVGTGPVNTFRVAQLAAATGQQIALDGTTLDAGEGCSERTSDVADPCADVPATPVFDWEPVDGAGMYIVYVSEDEDFTNLTESLSRLGATSNTRYTPTYAALREALPDSQAGASYYWYVRPCKTASICAASPVSTGLGVTNSFRKRSPAVVLEQPANDTDPTTTDVASPEVTFSWQDYRATNAATTWDRTGEQANQSAMQYRIQVDDDPGFASPLDSQLVDQPTYTAWSKTFPDGELYWRVQAVDAEGNDLTWSPTRELTKKSRPLQQLSPVNGASVAGTPLLSWEAAAYTGSYELEVYRNADTAASSVNRVLTVTTRQPAYVPTAPLPASTGAYVWRVRRHDATTAKYPGPWSAWGRFTATGSTPTLVSPASGTWIRGNDIYLDWSPVAGAASYRVTARDGGGRSMAGTPATTPATAWAPTYTAASGTWTWTVTALDTAGAPLGTSAARTLQVDSTAPTLVSLTPTSPRASSSFTATFSEPVTHVGRSTYRIRRAGTSTWLSATVTLSSDRKRALLNPSSNLRTGASYVIALSSTVTDLRGNPLTAVSRTVRIS
ncbi:hypothetical protein GCM10011584_11620 [Nocardioides phosphati]|uniref:SbsA Ig-like domain-containing protein n=1 Tax=Nocardioides phosphati TaxID=1867775 RepID=A0ABQ2N8Z0_9ACTN|nr:Ig-like domain-containing protein [Nocardioides phosphati]GGO87314.1 hypothetical protein GCM10011584_11620 [Nocardioides phosphati]